MLFFSDMGFWYLNFFAVLQYLLYGPFLAKVLYSRIQEETIEESWCLHILIICALRASIYQYWTSWSNMLFLTRNRRILPQGVDFNQIDKEWDWYILLISVLDFYLFSNGKNGFLFYLYWYCFRISVPCFRIDGDIFFILRFLVNFLLFLIRAVIFALSKFLTTIPKRGLNNGIDFESWKISFF